MNFNRYYVVYFFICIIASNTEKESIIIRTSICNKEKCKLAMNIKKVVVPKNIVKVLV